MSNVHEYFKQQLGLAPTIQRYYSLTDLAQLLCVSPHTLRSWSRHQYLPPPDVPNLRMHRWRADTVQMIIQKWENGDIKMPWSQWVDQQTLL